MSRTMEGALQPHPFTHASSGREGRPAARAIEVDRETARRPSWSRARGADYGLGSVGDAGIVRPPERAANSPCRGPSFLRAWTALEPAREVHCPRVRPSRRRIATPIGSPGGGERASVPAGPPLRGPPPGRAPGSGARGGVAIAEEGAEESAAAPGPDRTFVPQSRAGRSRWGRTARHALRGPEDRGGISSERRAARPVAEAVGDHDARRGGSSRRPRGRSLRSRGDRSRPRRIRARATIVAIRSAPGAVAGPRRSARARDSAAEPRA